MDADLHPAQGSLQATDDSLQQRYLPPAFSPIRGSIFSQPLPEGGVSRQQWLPVNQSIRHGSQRQQHPHLRLPPHHSAPPTFSGGSGLSHGLQPPSLFPLAHGDRQRSSVFGHGDQQRQQGEYPMGQLEQHYLTHLQPGNLRVGASAGGSSLLSPGVRPPSLQPVRSSVAWMVPQIPSHQLQRQPGSLARLGQDSAFGPNSQVTMNLEELSAVLQAERPQALPALQSQPPLTLAQSYLTQLRANAPPVRTQSSPLLGDASAARHSSYLSGQSMYGQGGSFPSWNHMQMPAVSLQAQGLQRMRDPVSSASEPRHERLHPGSDADAQNQSLQDDPHLFRRHHIGSIRFENVPCGWQGADI